MVVDQLLTAARIMTEAHVERQSSAIAALQSVDVETIFDKVRQPEAISAMFVDFASARRAPLCFVALQDDFDAEKYINEMFPSGALASEALCSANCQPHSLSVALPKSSDLSLMPCHLRTLLLSSMQRPAWWAWTL